MKSFISLNESVLKEAVQCFGREKQINMVIEECSELIKSLCKYKRGSTSSRENHIQVCEELADVYIMINQCRVMFDMDIVNEITVEKINRLYDLIKHEKP
jgi:NTP pyrophosphatase (non-canonical NTP hydrolase)